MIDRNHLRKRLVGASKHLATFGASLETECARLNDGLTAIAIALAIVVVLTAAVRIPVMFPDQANATSLPDDD